MKRHSWFKRALIVSAALLGVSASLVAVTRPTEASIADARRILGFEDTADWTASGGASTSLDSLRTEGASALAVDAAGYTTIQSRLFGPLGDVAETISLDILPPENPLNPYWAGDIQLFVSVPSQNVYSAFLGQKALTGLAPGQYHEAAFHVPVPIREALANANYDVQFSVALNAPSGTPRRFYIDNLQLGSTLPPRTTISSADLPRILGFESDLDWSVDVGSATLSAENRTQGNTSLAVQPNGYTNVVSVPMTSLGRVDETISVDILIPTTQVDPYWAGTLQLYVDLPSQGLWSEYIGEEPLTGLPTGEFVRITFDLTQAERLALEEEGYSDLRFRLALNVPSGSDVHYLDNFQVGEVTDPPQQPIITRSGVMIGRTSEGALSIAIDEHSDEPTLEDALFRVVPEDGLCVPSITQQCRFIVETIRFRFVDIDLAGQQFDTGIIRNDAPFRIAIGGTAGMQAFVPPTTSWTIYADNIIGHLFSSVLFMTVDPSGNGMISISGMFIGSVDEYALVVSGSVTADSPLLNRLPQANAGTDQTLSASSGCSVPATLNGSASSDPDNNIVRHWWTHRGLTVGEGATLPLTLDRSGTMQFDLWIRDAYGATASDSVLVDVTLPSGCPAL